MASLLAVPLKKTYELDFTKPLKTFIQNTFTQANPEDYNPALNELNKLRAAVITKSVDKHESALEVLYRYYDQLVAIENKLPIAENQVCCCLGPENACKNLGETGETSSLPGAEALSPQGLTQSLSANPALIRIRVQFKWRDAFDEGSFLSGKRNLAIASAAYEKVCVLFNIAALQSQVAAVQNHDSNDGLKLTVKLFQQACGIFGHLKDIVLSHVRQDPTPDINPDTLSALAALMLAQAQESIYRKATQDKMKEAMIAKLAYQTSELYSDAAKLMQLGSIRELWPKDWIPILLMKQMAFHGLAELYQSCVSQQSKSYGEEIARLQHAKELLISSQNRGGALFSFRQELSRVERALESAQKDNNFIYHDKIPDQKSLQPIGKAVVAKATPLSQPMSAKFIDLFDKIVPLPVHEALTSFENRKSQIASLEIGRLRSGNELINSVLASLNLPAALEDLSGERVPQSLLEKAQQIQDLGGLTKLDQLMTDMPELLTRNREILDESIKTLDEEGRSDQQLKEQFKDRWTRTPSTSLTKPMRDEAGKYRGILDTAVQADHIVKEKYNSHKSAISLLSKPKGELEAALPAATAAGSLQKSSVVARLRNLLEQVNTIKAEREVIESEIKDAKFDMSGKFLAALGAEGLINEESISVSELDRVYAPLRDQVTDSLHRQDILLSQIQNSNTEFCNAKTSSQSAAQRETLLKDLAAGFDMFMELKSNLEEGTKFYNDLTPLLVRLQSKINDFCFARKTEKEDLLVELQRAIANTPSQAPPVPPRYQGGAGQPPNQSAAAETPALSTSSTAPRPAPRAPPRPPPPAVPNTTATSSAAAVTATPADAGSSTPTAPAPHPSNPPQAHPGQSPPNPYGPPGGYPSPNWQTPYSGYPGQGYPAVQMPGSFNTYNPYLAYPQQPQYPPQGQPYGQPYPHSPYPPQHAPPPQAGYPYPGYPPQY